MRTAGLAHVLEQCARPLVLLRDTPLDLAAPFDPTLHRSLGLDWSPPRGLTANEVGLLGIAAHEIGHAAVAIAVGDVVESASVSRHDLSGIAPYWPRAARTAGSLIASIAVAEAGEAAYFRATGDALGAVLSGRADREDVEEALLGLPERTAATARELAGLIVGRVLDDRKVWRAVADLAIRLTDQGRVDGEELHRRIVIPGDVLTFVRALVA